jgi:hypothetical protein
MTFNETFFEDIWRGLVFFGLFLCLIFAVWFGLFEPSIIWLGSGEFPERDLFWLLGSPSCNVSIWADPFSGASDLCRRTYVDFTDALGLNKILNGFFDINLIFAWILSSKFITWAYL